MRLMFRWSRIAVWLLLLAIIVAVIYVNSIGLPSFLKEPLLAELRERGWDVEFSRMRWRWFRGIVIENATFSPVDKDSQSRFSTTEAELNVDFSRKKDSRVTLKSILIREGEFTATLETNTPPLLLEKIQATIHFLPDDRLLIQPFEAQFRGIHFQLSCDLTNASALKELSFLLPEKKPADASETAVKKWLEMVQEIQFADEPEVTLTASGDLRDWQKMTAELKVGTAGAKTPWGRFEGVGFLGEMNPRGTTNPPLFGLQLSATDSRTRWGSVKDLNKRSQFSLSDLRTNVLECEFALSGNQFRTRWITENATNILRSGKAQISGTTALSLTNFLPLAAATQVQLRQTNLRLQKPGSSNVINAALHQADFAVAYDPVRPNAMDNVEEFGFWTNLQPFTVSGRFDFGRVKDQQINLEKLLVSGDWAWPRVELMDVQSSLYGGESAVRGNLDVVTRELALNVTSSFDVKKISSLLPPAGQRVMADLAWKKPPRAEGDIRIILPAWTDAQPDWHQEILRTLQLNARVRIENGSYRKIPATLASTDLHYSNRVLRLPNIHLVTPTSEAKLSLLADERTHTFEAHFDGTIDPRPIRSQLDPEQQEWLDQVSFVKPPKLEARLRGGWDDVRSLSAEGRFSAEEFTVRGVDFSSVDSTLNYTNFVARFDDLLLKRNDKQIAADRITLHTNRIFFDNVASTLDPMLVADIIGEEVVEVLSPYVFAEPPHVLLNGSLGLQTIDDADMRFQIAGGKFQWGLLHADSGSGEANWIDETLTLTNLHAMAYGGGTLAGNAFLDFSPQVRADYRLDVTFTNVDVQSAVLSLNGTNEVEGLLNGALTVNFADTTGLHTWQGYGRGELTDGLIWEMPVFGIFTPVLNAIVPGLGKSRARSATADFIITNGVAFSDDLEIRSSGFRMQYRGTLSHELEINARVIAEPLRDTWVVGKLLSTALLPLSKLFEYKVTGPAHDPQMKPVYVPKVLMMTLRPFKTIKGLLPDDDKDEIQAVPILAP